MKKSIVFPLQNILMLIGSAVVVSFLFHPLAPQDGERERPDRPLEAIRF